MCASARNTVIAATLTLFSFISIRAEDVPLDRIVVTPSRIEESSSGTARNIDVITSRDIERSLAQDLGQVLKELASVNVSDYGGPGATKTVKMRGSSAAQVLVMVDGRPVNNPRDGEADLSVIPLENIERIEVMHGPGSSLYGTGAMGGTINIITKSPPQKGYKNELSASFGTFRTYAERFLHGGRVSSFAYLVGGGYQRSEGARDNAGFDAKDLNTKLEYAFSDDNRLSLDAAFYKGKLDAPGSLEYLDSDDKQRVLKHSSALDWVLKPGESTEVSARLYQGYDRLEFIENTAGSIFDTALDKNIHTTKTRGLDLQVNRQVTRYYQVIGGLSYATNLNDSTSSAKHDYLVRAWYLENKIDLFGRLKLDASARFDDYSNFGTEMCPSLGFLFALRDDIRLRGLVSRSFRAPTFNDLYWPDEGWSKGNPGLKPEKGLTREVGVEADIGEKLSCGLTYYRSDYDDLINWAEESGVWMPSNIGSAVIHGIEFESRVKLGDALSLSSGYAFLRAKDEDTHKYLNYQPKHKLDLSLAYRKNGFSCCLKGQFTDKRFHDAANTVKVKRFFTLGFDLSKRFNSKVTCFFSIDNLLGRSYEVVRSYPMPGFSLTSGLKLEF